MSAVVLIGSFVMKGKVKRLIDNPLIFACLLQMYPVYYKYKKVGGIRTTSSMLELTNNFQGPYLVHTFKKRTRKMTN